MCDVEKRVIGKENPQAEDRIFKFASHYFKEELLPYLEIYEDVCSEAPTEMIHLELRQMYQDFNYILKTGEWLHFEFVSGSISKKTLRNFRRYEAVTSSAYEVPVITYVVYTGDIKTPRDRLTEGINTYRVKMIRLQDRNADRFFEELGVKLRAGQIEKQDMLAMILTPLMSGEISVKERIVKSLDILKKHSAKVDKDDYQRMESMLYVLATKFLNEKDIKEVVEVLNMTILGEMLMEKCMEKGMEKGRNELLVKIVRKKLDKGYESSDISEVLELPLDEVEPICKLILRYPNDTDLDILDKIREDKILPPR